jgi:hypothetical protein
VQAPATAAVDPDGVDAILQSAGYGPFVPDKGHAADVEANHTTATGYARPRDEDDAVVDRIMANAGYPSHKQEGVRAPATTFPSPTSSGDDVEAIFRSAGYPARSKSTPLTDR